MAHDAARRDSTPQADEPAADVVAPAGARSTGVETRLLALQRTAGNRAVGALLAGRRPLARVPAFTPVTPDRSAAVREEVDLLEKTTLADRAVAISAHEKLTAEVDKLEPTDKRRVEAADQLKDFAARIGRAESDLRVLAAVRLQNETGPVIDQQKFDEIRTRRSAWIAQPTVTRIDTDSGTSVSDKGIVSSSTTGSTRVFDTPTGPDHKSTTTTKSSELGATGYKSTVETTDTHVHGSIKSTASKTRTGTVDWGGATPGVGVAWSNDKASTETDAGKSSSETANSVKAGTGGVSYTRDTKSKQDDVVDNKSTTVGVKRGDGELGVTFKQGSEAGKVDDKDKLVTGKKSEATGGMSATFDPEKGVGLGGNVGKTNTNRVSKNEERKTELALSGRALINVEPWTDPDPKASGGDGDPKFVVSLTVMLGVSAGGSITGEDERPDHDAKASITASGKVTAGLTANFKRLLSDTDAKAYVDAVKQGGVGNRPKHAELELIHIGKNQGWEAARRWWQAQSAGLSHNAAALGEGDSFKVTADGGVEGKVGGSVSLGPVGLGGERGASAKGTVEIEVFGLKDNRVKVVASVKGSAGTSKGATVTAGVVGGGLADEHAVSAGESVTFILDRTDNARYHERLTRIGAATSQADLETLARLFSDAVFEHTSSDGRSSGTTVKVTVPGAVVDLSGKAAYGREVKTDKDGQTSFKYTGENTGGGGVTLGSAGRMGDSTTEKYTGEVDKYGVAKGELDATRKSFSLSKSLIAASDALSDQPLEAASGGAKYVQEDSESGGIKMADADIEFLMRAATDPVSWNRRMARPKLLGKWRVFGERLAAAFEYGEKKRGEKDPDFAKLGRARAQKAIAFWMADEGLDRRAILEEILRPKGAQDHGVAYFWPDGTAQLKPRFDALVAGDVASQIAGDVAARLTYAVLDDAQKVVADLDSLYNQIKTLSYKWEEEHQGDLREMMHRTLEQATLIREQLRKGRAKLAPPAKKPPEGQPPVELAPANVTTVPTAAQMEEMRRREDLASAQREYLDMIAEMKKDADEVVRLGNEAKDWQTRTWAGIMTNRTAESIKCVNRAKSLLKPWDKMYWKAWALHEQYGFDKTPLEKYHPAGLTDWINKVEVETTH